MNTLLLSLNHFLVLGALLFGLGIFGALTRRSAIGILMSVELMFNGVNITLVALQRYLWPNDHTGQIFVIFAITVAAVESAVGLALVIAAYRRFRTAMADEVSLLHDGALAMALAPFRKMGNPEGLAGHPGSAPGAGH
ncbi:MAG: NADH-quinone oxidoreductase subunit NuoK [Myxococcota bacterium]|jgi:NADH-quinone oxidoreductase subunit K|nr:NADH-quinone oxidoreductase subunit NuoK [Myxococcota bacterium]